MHVQNLFLGGGGGPRPQAFVPPNVETMATPSNTVIVWVVLHMNMKLEIADSRAVNSLTISGLCISVGEGLHL
jgi:hypothetical protein